MNNRFSKCLKQAGLSKHESAIMRALTRGHKGTAAEKAVAAVRQRLKELRAEKASVEEQVKRAQEVGTGERTNPVQASTRDDVDAAAQRAATNPTPAQIEAGVNRKGHLQFTTEPLSGLGVVSIETAKGVKRIAKDGAWSSPPMPAHYGHLQIADGADGDKADITIGEDLSAPNAYVIDQIKDDGVFDETKSFVGFPSEDAARQAYLDSFSDDAAHRIGAITEMPVEQFVRKAQANELAKPVAYVKEPKLVESQDEKVAAVLDRAGVKGKERLDIVGQVKRGDLSPEDLEAAYPTEKPTVRNDPFLKWVKANGGIDSASSLDITGEKAFRANAMFPGLFVKQRRTERGQIIAGHGADDLAMRAVDAGFILPTEVDEVDGGTQAFKDKVDAILKGQERGVKYGANEDAALAAMARGRFDEQEVDESGVAALDPDDQAEALDLADDGVATIGSDWATMSEDEKNAELDALFGAPESPGGGAQTGTPEARPALSLEGQSEQEIAADEAARPAAEERALVDREREAFQLSQPEGSTEANPLAEPKNQKPMFKRSPAALGTDPDSLRSHIESLTQGWSDPPRFVTTAPDEWGFDAPSDARGAHLRGTVYLATNDSRIFFHETTHYALWKMGDEVEPALNHIHSVNPKIRRMAAAWRAKNNDVIAHFEMTPEQARLRSIDEALAEMSESGETINGVQRLLAAVQKWLRDHGMVNVADWLEALGDAEAMKLIADARSRIMRGEAHVITPQTAPAFSLGERIEQSRELGYRGLAQKVVNFFDEALNPLHSLPDQKAYLVDRYLAQGTIDGADRVAGEVKKTLAAATEQDLQGLYDYFTTAGASPDAIAEPLRGKAMEVKAEINRVGDELVVKGLLPAEARDQYRDAYLPRLYLKHLLSEHDWKALGTGKKPSDMGYLKKRKDIPEDVRRVILGEVTDPSFLAGMAIAKPMRDMALLDWLSKISANQNWILPGTVVAYVSPLNGQELKVTPYWLQSEAARLRKQAELLKAGDAQRARDEARAMDEKANESLDGIQQHEDYKQIPNTARYGRLRGLQVRKEIYDDLMGVNDFLPTDPGWFQSVFGYGGVGTKATQIWKTMKVSMNPPAQIRNFVSNAIAMQLFGGVPLRLVPARLFQAARDVADEGRYSQIARKYGVAASTFSNQEIYRMKTELLDLELKTRGMSPLGRIHRIGGIMMNKAGDIYQLSETIFKTATIMDAMERQGMSEQDAMILANKALFDYSLVQKSVRYARNAPIGIPFLTYSIKVLPRLVETALLHPERFLPWVGLFYGFPMMVASMLEVDTDDLDKLKKAMPAWLQDKGHALILPFKDDDGRWQVVDLGYFMPWSMWLQVGGQASKGEVGKAIQSTGLFGGPITDIVTAIRTGKNSFGNDIMKKGDSPLRQFYAMVNYTWSMAMPPIVTENGLVSPTGLLDQAYGGKLVQAIAGTTNKQGEPKATLEQAALYALGLSTRGLTPEFTRQTHIQKLTTEMHDAKRQMVYKLQDRSLSEEGRREIALEYAGEIMRRAQKLQTYVRDSQIAPALATRH